MTEVDAGVWQDREIRFDVPFALLKPRRGEVEIDSINSVEDTKGNNGEKGQLAVTNLRLIWCSHKDPRTNLSQMTTEQRVTMLRALAWRGAHAGSAESRVSFFIFVFQFATGCGGPASFVSNQELSSFLILRAALAPVLTLVPPLCPTPPSPQASA